MISLLTILELGSLLALQIKLLKSTKNKRMRISKGKVRVGKEGIRDGEVRFSIYLSFLLFSNWVK